MSDEAIGDDDGSGLGAQGIGARVRAVRKLAGLTQRQLAARTHFSYGLVRQVEQGTAPASPAFVAAAARSLHISVAELQAHPAHLENADDYRVHAVIAPLRRELAMYRMPPDQDGPVPDLNVLAAQVARLSALRQAADLAALGIELPSVLAELRTAAHMLQGAERERVYGLLAEAYAAAGQVCYKLRYSDLSSVTTERVEWAAAASGDELAMAAADFYRAGEIINAADWSAAAVYLEAARHRIEHRRREGDEPGLSMWGQLHLKSGLAAARGGDGDQADAHLKEAQDVAEHVGPARDDYRLAFNQSSVDIWGVGLAVEAMDGPAAVKRAERMAPPTSAPRERVGHHHIDTARAYLLVGNRRKTFDSLMAARRVSPQQTRHHPQVHETLRLLAERDRRRSDTLAGYVRWAGVAV